MIWVEVGFGSDRWKSSGIGEKLVVGFRAGDEAMDEEGEVEEENEVEVEESESENASGIAEVDAKRYEGDGEGSENETPLSRRLVDRLAGMSWCCIIPMGMVRDQGARWSMRKKRRGNEMTKATRGLIAQSAPPEWRSNDAAASPDRPHSGFLS